jgi:2-polyprenyl-3-methyl-5-hydroxy-6-metoxy-1,4-benzoquinol methylase
MKPSDQLQKSLIELREAEHKRTSGVDAAKLYQSLHANRFERTFRFCKEIIPDVNARILDVGPSQLTVLLKSRYANLSTFGLNISADDGGQRTNETLQLNLPHISCDLNCTQFFNRWPDIKEKFELIVFAETIEHLAIAPEYVVAFLASLLTEQGILLITTPNAATIMKRLILLLKGKNPYNRIRLLSDNPGHFREYTMKEMIEIGTHCGLKVVRKEFINMYTAASNTQALLKRIKPSFYDTIVIAFQR